MVLLKIRLCIEQNKLFYVYLIISERNGKFKTYVGYTNNLKQRIAKHNTNKGAKSTRGRYWELIYKKFNKKLALKYEYFLKTTIYYEIKIKINMSTKHVVILKNDAVGDLVHSLKSIYNVTNANDINKITILYPN